MAFAGMGVWALVGQGLVSQAVGVVILWAIVAWRPRFAFSRRHFADLFGFGFNVLATNLLRIFGGQADRLLLGFYFGATEVGYYSVAQRLVSIITDFVAGSTERAVVPLFSRIQEDRQRVARGLITAQRLLSLISDPGLHRPGRHRPLAASASASATNGSPASCRPASSPSSPWPIAWASSSAMW